MIEILSFNSFNKVILSTSFAFLFVFSSCVSNKKIPYFQNVPDSLSTRILIKEAPYTDPLIQPDDIVTITVQTIDPQNSSIVGKVPDPIPSAGMIAETGNKNQVPGYIVDRDGYVEIPLIGKVKIGGLSTFKARELLQERASQFFKNPTVQVRYSNYKVTILGEVNKPGIYTVPNERVSVLDAIGMAGDLSIYGKRYNVLLIREKDSKKEFVRLDLNSTDIFQSPYFYLRQNDVLYIEPTKAKVASLNIARTQTYALIGTLLSTFVIVLTNVNR